RQLGHAHPDQTAQRLPGRARGGEPAPRARRHAAADPLRHPGVGPTAAHRPLHHRVPPSRLPSAHPAPSAGDLRLHRHSHPPGDADAGEEEAAVTTPDGEGAGTGEPQSLRGPLPRYVLVTVGIAALAVTIMVVRELQSIVAPVFLALNLVLIV